MIPFVAGASDAVDEGLLRRAADWPEHRSFAEVTAGVLQSITGRQGIDFATALLFDRFSKSPPRSPFIEHISQLRRHTAPARLELDARVVIVPGALYLERPDMGGDGRIVRAVAAQLGLQSEMIPLASCGSVRGNAALIREWLERHSTERIILVSLSKGGADLKFALSGPGAPHEFPNVVAWISVCGPLRGSRMANWVMKSGIRRCFFRWKFRWQERDFGFITDLLHGANTPLDFDLRLPSSTRLLSLIGFPLRRHMTTRFSRFCHRIIASHGPNDGTTLLTDLRSLPGEIYPVWGMDHYFRPESEAKALVTVMLQYLADTCK